jgi:trimethylamine---corrinoid protein Co-methyltransferase
MHENIKKESNIVSALYSAKWNILDQKQVEAIHRASIKILENTGIRMPHGELLDALEAKGAKVDREKGLVFWPPELVEELLAKAPSVYTLYAVDPARDLPLDGAHGYLTLDGSGLQVIDFADGRLRTSTKKDLEEATRVADYLEQVAFLWPAISAQDYPQKVQPLHELEAMLSNTTKHIQAMTAVNAFSARGSLEIAAAVAGGEKALKERPIISSFQCSISPLAYDAEGLEAAYIFARAGIPAGFMTMQVGCSTAPATIAGNLALGNAEIIAGMAALQVLCPGAPTFYGSCATVMELKSGGVACGGPEDFMLQAMSAQMARHYKIPSNIGTFATGAKASNWHAGVENAASGAASIFAGADMMCGAGLLNGARIFSFEQLLMDCEIFEILRRIAGGIVVNDQTLALDIIHGVGPGDHFMAEEHTFNHLREIWQPTVINRSSYEQWQAGGRRDALEKAHEQAAEILANHRPEILAESVKKEIAKIISAYQSAH